MTINRNLVAIFCLFCFCIGDFYDAYVCVCERLLLYKNPYKIRNLRTLKKSLIYNNNI